ncbi:MAG: sodium:proton antiporter [Gammaproteobacteria bacterium]|nr:MAG: sodium:proton antiporter [Gammaproteobacteria bacterium]RLA31055.1 MAG: sodium:proton antiporter [Gammaproteobacteria bacterium]
MSIFEIGAFLIGLSAFFGYINHRFLRLPHTVGLVVMALAASLSLILIEFLSPRTQLLETVTGILEQIDFHETVMHGMLSFLLFAGAMHVDFSVFRSRLLSISLMATLGILISTFLIGWVMWLLLNFFGIDIPFMWALVFGALISPTDPVAVLGLFKTVKVPESLEAKMAGESLLNDGVGVVVFTIVVAIAVGGDMHGEAIGVMTVVELFFTEAVGGAILGLVAGYACYRAMGQIDEHNLEVLITLAMVMVTYAVATRLHLSGPIAMVVAGLFIGNRGMKNAVSDKTRDYVEKFWSLLDEILNSVLFLLIGLEVLVIAQRMDHIGVALLAIPVTLIARWISVSVPITILARWKSFTKGAIPILTWGGLRGGIAVALALSLPVNEYKPTILTITYAVVLFSIIVQGLTIKPLVEKLVTKGPIDDVS